MASTSSPRRDATAKGDAALRTGAAPNPDAADMAPCLLPQVARRDDSLGEASGPPAAVARVPPAPIIGITGAAGSGKSSVIAALTRSAVDEGLRVAIVAVDPSSARTGGALLGDRARFGDLLADDRVFLRSLAAAGALGGLSETAEAVIEAVAVANFDLVFVETVGAGQGDQDIVGVADVVALVLAPGNGDELQALKAGIQEVADVLIANKADLPGHAALCQQLAVAQATRAAPDRQLVLAMCARRPLDAPAILQALRGRAAARCAEAPRRRDRERLGRLVRRRWERGLQAWLADVNETPLFAAWQRGELPTAAILAAALDGAHARSRAEEGGPAAAPAGVLLEPTSDPRRR